MNLSKSYRRASILFIDAGCSTLKYIFKLINLLQQSNDGRRWGPAQRRPTVESSVTLPLAPLAAVTVRLACERLQALMREKVEAS